MTHAKLDKARSLFDQLIEKIFSGEYPPGTPLVERQLASELGVSRIPVREALTQLVARGVLDGGEKRRSVRVRRYTPDEIRQLYQFREAIEGGAARAAATTASLEDLRKLKDICDQMEREVGHYGSVWWAQLDQQFHQAIAEASANQWFMNVVNTLVHEWYYVFYRVPAYVRPKRLPEEARQWMQDTLDMHRHLLACVEAGDADGAERAAREHIHNSVRLHPWHGATGESVRLATPRQEPTLHP